MDDKAQELNDILVSKGFRYVCKDYITSHFQDVTGDSYRYSYMTHGETPNRVAIILSCPKEGTAFAYLHLTKEDLAKL